ncbi:glycosyltransferase family 2 protein [Verrucomicrobiota bacterium]
MNAAEDTRATVSVVIPVLNAETSLPALLDRLFSQKPAAPTEVILVDSMSTDKTRNIAQSNPRVSVIPITRFSHGRARNLGAQAATGDVVVLMTQDALPKDDAWLASLLASFSDEQVAAVYSRQVPWPDAPPTERFFLRYHFPSGDPVRRVKTGNEQLTFKNVFFSNVSAAVRRSILLRFPFDETLIMSEDQQFARELLDAGHAVVYQPESVVFHSHRYTLKTAFQRYFDSVYSLTVIFSGHGMGTSASIGLRYLGREMRYILRHHPLYFPYYCLYTLAKTFGTVAGHFADKMPEAMLKKLSMHSYHWDKDDSGSACSGCGNP